MYPLSTLQVMAIKTKDAGLRLRVERDLREQFVDRCRADGQPAAEVLRSFMREYVAQSSSPESRKVTASPGRRAQRQRELHRND